MDRGYSGRSRFEGQQQDSWGEKRHLSSNRNQGDGILGAPPPFLYREEKKETRFPESRSSFDRSTERMRRDDREIGRPYSKNYDSIESDYHEPLQGDLEDDYLYNKNDDRERKLSHGDGLSPDVKQLMNSLGLSKSDMEELSRLPDCELSVNNLMHAIGELRRKKSASNSSSKSSYDRERHSRRDGDYYDPEEPTDLNDRYTPPTRSKSPSRLADAFSNFQEKWYDQTRDKKNTGKHVSTWKPKEAPPQKSSYRSPRSPEPLPRRSNDRERYEEPFRGQPEQPNIRRVEMRSRPSRWESQENYESRPPQPRPLSGHGLLGNPHHPNALELDRLAAKTKSRDDGLVGYQSQARQAQKPQQQRFQQRQDKFENKQHREMHVPERTRPRDDGLDDDYVPVKRRNVNQQKKIQQPQQIHGLQPMPAQQMQQVLLPIVEPIQQLQQQSLLLQNAVPTQAVLAAQMQAMRVLKNESLKKGRNDGRKDIKDRERGGAGSSAHTFTKAEAAKEAKEMRAMQGRVIYLRYKSTLISEDDLVKLAEPFDKVTNVLIIEPTRTSNGWYQAFLELSQFDCAAAMVEHYMPAPPRIRGIVIQVQKSNYQTLQIREDQMGRKLATKNARNRRHSISPLRENSNNNKNNKEKQRRRSASPNKNRARLNSSDNDRRGNKRGLSNGSKEESGKKQEEQSSKKSKVTPEKQKSPTPVKSEKTKSGDKKVVEKKPDKNKIDIKKEKATSSPIKIKKENVDSEHFEVIGNVSTALKNAEKLQKMLEHDECNKLVTNIIDSLEVALKSLKN